MSGNNVADIGGIIRYLLVDTTVGPLLVAGDGEGIVQVHFQAGVRPLTVPEDWSPAEDALLEEARRQIGAWFAGRCTAFSLPLNPEGTPWQHRVWTVLATIPYGETRSYGELAAELGNARGARAVGTAVGRNPLPLLVPCHRVIGRDGSLTGFSAGLDIKRRLLGIEREFASREPAGR